MREPGPNLAKPHQPAAPSSGLVVRTLNGVYWTFTGAGFQALLKIVVLSVLARLLAPDEFGVVSAAMTLVALAELFGRVGVAPAIVQSPDLDENKIRTASTITMVTALASGLVLFLSSSNMAGLFQIPAVEPVIRALSLVFVVSGFSIVSEALLQREMRFRAIATVSVGSYLFGYAAVSISMALAGFGIWALVWGQVAQVTLAGVGYVLLARPCMRPLLHGPSVHQLFHFGAGVTLSRFGNYIAMNADYFIVGRWFGADSLGFYSRAYVLLMQPTQLVGTVGDKVLFPAFASVQDDDRQLLRGYYRAIALIFMVTLPLTGVLLVLAPEIVRTLLGPQWTATILPFQILLVSLPFRTAYKVSASLLRSRGSVYMMAVWQWGYAGLVILGALIGMHWGIVGVAAGVSTAIIVSFWAGVYVTTRCSPTSVGYHAAILARHFIEGVIVTVPLIMFHAFLVRFDLHDLVVIAACCAFAGVIFLASFLTLKRLFGEEGAWALSLVTPVFERFLKRT